MNVLIGCEYTGTGQREFSRHGHNAWSCDIDPTEGNPYRHLQMDIFEALDFMRWDLIILHPDCTKMAVCGNRWWAGTPAREMAVKWTRLLWERACERAGMVCLENPGSVIFPVLREQCGADVQYVQPWQFGHPETKKTGLALHGLPRLVETNNVHEYMMTLPEKERHRVHRMPPGPNRGKDRSRSYPGMLEAMALQWS